MCEEGVDLIIKKKQKKQKKVIKKQFIKDQHYVWYEPDIIKGYARLLRSMNFIEEKFD